MVASPFFLAPESGRYEFLPSIPGLPLCGIVLGAQAGLIEEKTFNNFDSGVLPFRQSARGFIEPARMSEPFQIVTGDVRRVETECYGTA